MRWANLGCQSLNYVTYLRAMNGPCIFQYYPSDENTIKIYFYCLNENKKIKHAPAHRGGTKASPSEGDLSGNTASQTSTAFNDAVSGRSEGRSSGSPDLLTGAATKESLDTYVTTNKQSINFYFKTYPSRIEVQIGYPDEEQGNPHRI